MPGTARNCWDGFGRPFVRGVDGLNQFLTLRGRLQALGGIVFVSSVGDGPRPFPGSPLSFGRVHERPRVGRAFDHNQCVM